MSADGQQKTLAVACWNGFNASYERVTQGRHDVKALKAYLEERASIEDSYVKGLLKLATMKEFEVQSSLSKCFTDLKEATKTMAQQHQALAGAFRKDLAVEVEKNIVMLKKEKTKMQKEHEQQRSDIEKKTNTHNRSKTRYYDAVKTAETAILNHDAGKKEHLPEKTLAELEAKVKKSLAEVTNSHKQYETAVSELKGAQHLFDEKNNARLNQMEALEREREKNMAEFFRRIADAHEALSNTVHSVYESLARGIETVNVESDIQEFINVHEAKESPPPHVVYMPHTSEIIDHALGGPAPSRASVFASGSANGISPNGGHASSMGGSAAAGAGVGLGAAAAAAAVASPAGGRAGGGGSAAAGGAGGGSDAPMAKALYDFDSTQGDDLPFKEGDLIKVLDMSDPDWWRGEIRGKIGMFPSNYVALASMKPVGGDAGAGGGGLGGGGGGAKAIAPASASPAKGAGTDEPKAMSGKCEALYDFEGQGADELSFKTGETLIVTGEVNGWYVGNSTDGKRSGIFPANYVRML